MEQPKHCSLLELETPQLAKTNALHVQSRTNCLHLKRETSVRFHYFSLSLSLYVSPPSRRIWSDSQRSVGQPSEESEHIVFLAS